MLLNNFRDVLRRWAFSARMGFLRWAPLGESQWLDPWWWVAGEIFIFLVTFPHFLLSSNPLLGSREETHRAEWATAKVGFWTQTHECMTKLVSQESQHSFESGTSAHCGMPLLALELFVKSEHVGSGGRLYGCTGTCIYIDRNHRAREGPDRIGSCLAGIHVSSHLMWLKLMRVQTSRGSRIEAWNPLPGRQRAHWVHLATPEVYGSGVPVVPWDTWSSRSQNQENNMGERMMCSHVNIAANELTCWCKHGNVKSSLRRRWGCLDDG